MKRVSYPCFLFLAAISALMLGGCLSVGQRFYIPNKVNTPVLHETGDMHLAAGVNVLESIGGFNLQAAARPHPFIMAHGHLLLSRASGVIEDDGGGIFFPTPVTDPYESSVRGWSADIGVGPHWQCSENLALSMPIGFSLGRTKHDFDYGRIVDLRTRRIYAQPTMSLQIRKFTFGTGLRFVHLDYYKSFVDATIERDDLRTLVRLNDERPFFFPELGVNIGHSLGKGVSIEYGFTNLIYTRSIQYGLGDRSFTLDLVFNPSEWRKKGKK